MIKGFLNPSKKWNRCFKFWNYLLPGKSWLKIFFLRQIKPSKAVYTACSILRLF